MEESYHAAQGLSSFVSAAAALLILSERGGSFTGSGEFIRSSKFTRNAEFIR